MSRRLLPVLFACAFLAPACGGVAAVTPGAAVTTANPGAGAAPDAAAPDDAVAPDAGKPGECPDLQHRCDCATGYYCLPMGAMCRRPTAECPPDADAP